MGKFPYTKKDDVVIHPDVLAFHTLPDDHCINSVAASQLLNVTRIHLSRLIKLGVVPKPIRLGLKKGQLRFHVGAFRKFLRTGEVS
jgi:hypothetical protein